MNPKDLITILIVVVILNVVGITAFYFFYLTPKISETNHPCEKRASKIDIDACYFNFAEETQDAGLCEKMSDESVHKGTCFIRVAKQTKDSRTCKKISDDPKKYLCHAIVANDSNLCEEAPEVESRNICYFDFALKTQEGQFCEKITNAAIKNNCYMFVK